MIARETLAMVTASAKQCSPSSPAETEGEVQTKERSTFIDFMMECWACIEKRHLDTRNCSDLQLRVMRLGLGYFLLQDLFEKTAEAKRDTNV